MIRQMQIVGHIEYNQIRLLAGLQTSDPVRPADGMSGIDGHRCNHLCRGHLHVKTSQIHHQKQGFGRGRARIAIRRQGHRHPGINHLSPVGKGGHQEKGRSRKQDRHHFRFGECADSFIGRFQQMVRGNGTDAGSEFRPTRRFDFVRMNLRDQAGHWPPGGSFQTVRR